MGRRSLPLELISNSRRRSLVKNKRKKGLLKKAMELAILCDLRIYIAVFDKRFNTLLEYLSDDQFSHAEVQKCLQKIKCQKKPNLH